MPKGVLLFPFLFSLVSAATGATERHLGPHVHGQASVNVSTEAHALAVELSLPGHDAVGFEHAPGSAAETRALDEALSSLRGARWIQLPAAAGCRIVSTTVAPHGFGGASEPGGHADFDASYRFDCVHPDRLDRLDVLLIHAFPSVQKVVVDVITSEGSTEQVLEGTNHQVTLGP